MHTLPEMLLSDLSGLLAEQTGLNFPEERWRDLERGMSIAADEFGRTDVESFARWILSEPLTRHQIEMLASHLTVGETYFFRDRASFDALEQNILPRLIQSRRNSGRFLRIWSAGCCTGEEPYSIAMLLNRLLPADEQWHITLLATDINPNFLRKAMSGIYGDWSFRGTPNWIRDRYFTQKRQGRFELDPRIRKMVRFSYLNLAEDTYPALSNNTNAMDLIFCRNVLMYFTEECMHQVIGNLSRALVDGGSLNVSPSEASSRLFTGFSPLNFREAAFYQKTRGGSPPTTTSEPSWLNRMPTNTDIAQEIFTFSPTPVSLPELSQPDVTAIDTSTEEEKVVPDTDDSSEELYAKAKLCANQGRLTEAAGLCEQAIAKNKLNPQIHYLLATIWQELGQDDAAELALKRALYLNPDFALAFFAFGNLRLSQGRYREAERHLNNALKLLRRQDPLTVVSEADGLLAGRLCEITASVMESLPRSEGLRTDTRAQDENVRTGHA